MMISLQVLGEVISSAESLDSTMSFAVRAWKSCRDMIKRLDVSIEYIEP